jgi:hypothetical protein
MHRLLPRIRPSRRSSASFELLLGWDGSFNCLMAGAARLPDNEYLRAIGRRGWG